MKSRILGLLVLIILGSLFQPLSAGEPPQVSDQFHIIRENITPLIDRDFLGRIIPSMSSYEFQAPLRFLTDVGGSTLPFQLNIWTLADVPYLIPFPNFNFFELGMTLGYYPLIAEGQTLFVGAGTAIDYWNRSISVPLIITGEYSILLSKGFWLGGRMEGYIYGNGFGTELSLPLHWYSNGWFFAGIQPTLIYYRPDGESFTDLKIAIELGYRVRK
jgi:hypothetical protein